MYTQDNSINYTYIYTVRLYIYNGTSNNNIGYTDHSQRGEAFGSS